MSSPVDRLNELPPLPRRTPPPRRAVRYVLGLLAMLLVANAVVGERGLMALFRANDERAELRQSIDTVRDENVRLHRYIQALTEQPRFVEDVARRELGMIKPGEQLFVVRTTTVPAAPPQPKEGVTSAPGGTSPAPVDPTSPTQRP